MDLSRNKNRAKVQRSFIMLRGIGTEGRSSVL